MTATITRRALVKAAPAIAATAFLAGPAVAQAVPSDAKFWQAHTKWAQIRASWDADKDPDEDARYQRWNDVEAEAFKVMALTPAPTAAAILAKHKAAHYDQCSPEFFALEAIEADLAALAARETV